MRKTVRALLLVLSLSVCIYAGDMGNGVAPPPQEKTQTASEPPTPANDDTSAEGDMGNGVMTTAAGAALNLIRTLLTLF